MGPGYNGTSGITEMVVRYFELWIFVLIRWHEVQWIYDYSSCVSGHVEVFC